MVNLGIQLLRMFLCLWIVIIHTSVPSNQIVHILFFKRNFHVPSFIIISFYFQYKTFFQRNITKIKERFMRLLFPYILLPIIIWIFNNLLFLFFNFNRFGRKLSIKELLFQLLIGRPVHNIFWYQFNVLFITLFIIIIFFLFKKLAFRIFIILFILAYLLQYSEYNTNFFNHYSKVVKYSLGNIVEVFPFSITGLLFASINFIENLKNKRLNAIIFSFLNILFISKYQTFIIIKGFFYPGIIQNIGAIFLFIFFSLISFDFFQKSFIISIIKHISNFTGGIYYFHPIIYEYLKINLSFIKNKEIYGSLIIYLISYMLCFFGMKIFGKTKLKFLFS